MAKVFSSLCENRDFRRLYARGQSFVHPALCVYVMKSRHHTFRVGITAGKKVGNAVQRNRARRIIRESFRNVLPRLRPGFDIVFVARSRTPSLKSTDLDPVIAKSFSVLGLLKL